MGNSKSSYSETLGWNNIKTEDFSDMKGGNNGSKLNFNGLSSNALELLSKLDINALSDSESEAHAKYFFEKANTLSDEDKKEFTNIFKQATLNNLTGGSSKNVTFNNIDSEFSDTSAFISSEMYSNMFGKQKGGANNLDDDSSTSSTSSDAELKEMLSDDISTITSDEEDNSPSEKKTKKHDKKDKKDKKHKIESSESQTAGTLSYISSSAHTDGDFSSSEKSEYQRKLDSVSEQSSSASSENNSEPSYNSYSINTSDINLIN